jgi:GNAT superfamily N-acetyltransferase
MMLVSDWREIDASAMRALYERELEAWRRELSWDASSVWGAVEHARTTWGLPGLVARTADRIVGWTFYLNEDGCLKIGGLVSETRDATALLLASLVDRARPIEEGGISLFVYDRAVALAHVLEAHGFVVERYRYLSATLPLSAEIPGRGEPGLEPGARQRGMSRASDGAFHPGRVRRHGAGGLSGGAAVAAPALVTGPWRPSDVAPAADLLAAAYGSAGMHFAPNNRPEEWQRYVRNLVEHAGVGVLMPDASRVVREGARIRSLVLLTQIADRTAHIAQVAVDPTLRRQGLAATLVAEACALASEAGCTVATLLVGAANRAACALYDRMGFRAGAAFIAATRAHGLPASSTGAATTDGRWPGMHA